MNEKMKLEDLEEDAPGPVQPIIDEDGDTIDYRSIYDDDE